MAAVAVTPSHRMPRDLPLADVVDRCHGATSVVRQALQGFWGRSAQVRLLAVSERNLYVWGADDFFVTQYALGSLPEDVAQLRLCEVACQTLLDSALGLRAAPGDFALKQLSALESQILGAFAKDALAAVRPVLMRQKRSRRLAPGWMHVCWVVRLSGASAETQDTQNVGKIILTLPRQAFLLAGAESAKAPMARAPLDDAFFFHARQPVRLWVGRTRLSLHDLEQLESGDLVVLNDSRRDRWAYLDPDSGRRVPFGVRQERLAGLILPNAQESRIMETSAPMSEGRVSRGREQLWRNLPIEVHAEFAPVRLPLHQVKQMTEGLIVEVGDLTANRIRLHVEGKTVAVGELVIVGDRFGVRICRVGEDPDVLQASAATVHLLGHGAAPSAEADAPHAALSAPAPTPMASDPAASDTDAFDEWVESDDDSWLNDDEFNDEDT